VVGGRGREMAAGGVLKSTIQFAFDPSFCLRNRQPPPLAGWAKNKFNSFISVHLSSWLPSAWLTLCSATLAAPYSRGSNLRLVPQWIVSGDQCSHPAAHGSPNPTQTFPVRLESVQRHAVLALEQASESRPIGQSVRLAEASLCRPGAPFV
jgi:capsid protein